MRLVFFILVIFVLDSAETAKRQFKFRKPTMPIPDYQSIMLPLLQFASDGGEHRSRDGITALAHHFNLTPEEVATLLPSGQDYLFGNRWGWARTYLKKAGLIAYPSRGKFQITSEGRSLLSEQPAKINVALLKRYPSF